MSEVLKMSNQKMFGDSRNVTSSQALADGLTRSDLRDGQTMNLFGQEVALVSRSVSQGTEKAPPITATYGRFSSGSLKSVALQQSLGNKLREQLGGDGLIGSATTWRRKITPSGRVYFRLVPLEHSTYGKDFGGLRVPTPSACDHKGSGRLRKNRGPGNNLRDWFRQHYGFLYPPARVVGYLMGFPPEWCDCAVTAMQSSQRSRKNSSRRT